MGPPVGGKRQTSIQSFFSGPFHRKPVKPVIVQVYDGLGKICNNCHKAFSNQGFKNHVRAFTGVELAPKTTTPFGKAKVLEAPPPPRYRPKTTPNDEQFINWCGVEDESDYDSDSDSFNDEESSDDSFFSPNPDEMDRVVEINEPKKRLYNLTLKTKLSILEYYYAHDDNLRDTTTWANEAFSRPSLSPDHRFLLMPSVTS
jgi:hypothetical protein